MSTVYTIGNIQHSLMALKEKIDPDKWGDTPLPVIVGPSWWMSDVANELGAPPGTELAEIHSCSVIRNDDMTEPMLLDHDGRMYALLPQWMRAKKTAEEGGSNESDKAE